MKKVVAFIGSSRKKGTYESVQMFEKALSKLGDVEVQYILLSDVELKLCLGCKRCFDKGESYCPLTDDRDKLLNKIEAADGVVFASPNYAFQVSARMKNLIDRLAFTFHRPRYFEKACTAIVVQGVYGGSKISRYLESTGKHIGFQVSKGCVINTLEPMSDKRYQAMEKTTEICAKHFWRIMARQTLPKPTLFQLMMFRMTRSGIHDSPVRLYDYAYFGELGWYDSEYYYKTKLGIIGKTMGKLFDFAGRQVVKLM